MLSQIPGIDNRVSDANGQRLFYINGTPEYTFVEAQSGIKIQGPNREETYDYTSFRKFIDHEFPDFLVYREFDKDSVVISIKDKRRWFYPQRSLFERFLEKK